MFIHDASPKALVEYLHLSESVFAKSRLQDLTYTWNGRRFSFEVQFSRLSSLVIHRNGHYSRDFVASPVAASKNGSDSPCGEERKAAALSPLSEMSDLGRGVTSGSRCLSGLCEENGVKQRHPSEVNELKSSKGSNFVNDGQSMNMRNFSKDHIDLNTLNHKNHKNDTNYLNDTSHKNALNVMNNQKSMNSNANSMNSNANSMNSNANSMNPLIDPIHPLHSNHSFSTIPSFDDQRFVSAGRPRQDSKVNGVEQGAGCLRRIVIDGFARRVPMRYVVEFLSGIQVVEARYVEGIHGFSLWIIGRMWWSDLHLMAFFETHPLDGMILFLRESSLLCSG